MSIFQWGKEESLALPGSWTTQMLGGARKPVNGETTCPLMASNSFSSLVALHHMEFLGQGTDLSRSCDLSGSFGNAGPSTHRARLPAHPRHPPVAPQRELQHQDFLLVEASGQGGGGGTICLRQWEFSFWSSWHNPAPMPVLLKNSRKSIGARGVFSVPSPPHTPWCPEKGIFRSLGDPKLWDPRTGPYPNVSFKLGRSKQTGDPTPDGLTGA